MPLEHLTEFLQQISDLRGIQTLSSLGLCEAVSSQMNKLWPQGHRCQRKHSSNPGKIFHLTSSTEQHNVSSVTEVRVIV